MVEVESLYSTPWLKKPLPFLLLLATEWGTAPSFLEAGVQRPPCIAKGRVPRLGGAWGVAPRMLFAKDPQGLTWPLSNLVSSELY